MRSSFQVPYAYTVHFTQHALHRENPILAEQVEGGRKVLCVIDQGVARAFPELRSALADYFAFHGLRLCATRLMPGGEMVKEGDRYVLEVLNEIDRHGLCRHCYLLAIGGGALLDMAGFAAATAHRGVRLVRMPTTVLAQNDSGVGVKNGINRFGKKNFQGAFAPPQAVINDWTLLPGLSERDWRSGFAEAVKVALVRDAGFFRTLTRGVPRILGRDRMFCQEVIQRCAELHIRHIAEGGDPFESGTSRPLDFGHWSAHKLESLSSYRLSHGEAVAVGLALDCTYASRLGELSDCEAILKLLERLGFDLAPPELSDPALLDGIEEFRQHLGGQLALTLIRSPGMPFEVNTVELSAMREAVARLLERSAHADRVPA